MTRRHAGALFILLLPLLAACQDNPTAPQEAIQGPQPDPWRLVLEPEFLDLDVGHAEKLIPRLLGAANSYAPPPVGITWLTSDPAVAIVSEDGMVHGVGAGNARIRALADGFMATARVRVEENR